MKPSNLRKGTFREGGLGWPAMSWGEICFFVWEGCFGSFFLFEKWIEALDFHRQVFFNGCSDKDGLLWKMACVPVLSLNYTPDFGSAYLSIWNISELTFKRGQKNWFAARSGKKEYTKTVDFTVEEGQGYHIHI